MIEDILIRPFAIDLVEPLKTAAGAIDTREGFVVRIESENEVGFGEATPLAGWTESLSRCRDALKRVTTGLGTDDIDAALADLDGTPAARHGLSLALADLGARRDGEPLYRHLGSDRRTESVPVNATIGDGPADETAARARAAVESGFRTLKIKVGVRTVSKDSDRLAAVREAIGPSIELRADANGAWTREEARSAFDAFSDLDVSYVEQPLAADDIGGHSDLRGGQVGVALDESLIESSVDEIIEADAADVLVLKPMALGGIDRARTAALRAREAGVSIVVTTTIDAAVARTAAVHLAASLPESPACGLATAELLAEDLAPDPAPIENGTARVPQEKGLGVEVDWGG